MPLTLHIQAMLKQSSFAVYVCYSDQTRWKKSSFIRTFRYSNVSSIQINLTSFRVNSKQVFNALKYTAEKAMRDCVATLMVILIRRYHYTNERTINKPWYFLSQHFLVITLGYDTRASSLWIRIGTSMFVG